MVPGEMRSVLTVDENTGLKTREFIGPTSFVHDPAYGARACRRVTRINLPASTPLYAADRAAMAGGW
jgi:hypothetical protein